MGSKFVSSTSRDHKKYIFLIESLIQEITERFNFNHGDGSPNDKQVLALPPDIRDTYWSPSVPDILTRDHLLAEIKNYQLQNDDGQNNGHIHQRDQGSNLYYLSLS